MRPILSRPSSSAVLELRARQMRSSLTPSEQVLWAAIRGRRLGVQFRRQVVIGRYIVDFLAPELRLVVEVDGGYHVRHRAADERRTAKLRRAGYHVLRLDAELVLRELPLALAIVSAAITELRR